MDTQVNGDGDRLDPGRFVLNRLVANPFHPAREDPRTAGVGLHQRAEKEKFKLFKHQQETIELAKTTDCLFIASDPGTGKTLTCLEIIQLKAQGRVLVLAPLSILEPAWGNDIKKFHPEFNYTVAYAKNRREAFLSKSKIVITNHDAVKWLEENEELLNGFDTLIIDESTAFRNPTAKRTKSITKLSKQFRHRYCLSGTPTPNGTIDLWNQMFICDGGERLGKSYYAFRNSICSPEPIGRTGISQWVEKPGASEAVSSLVADIMVRYKLEDVIELPENVQRTITYHLEKKHRSLYDEFHRTKILELERGEITAANAAVHVTKLLQMCSGAVYDANGRVAFLDDGRYQLCADLVAETSQSVVAFNWGHQRDRLAAEMKSRNITYGVIDGEVPNKERTQLVEKFQAGQLQCILAHPASAGHGLTLTNGVRTIWVSPTYNCEHYTQFNHRIYRAGQKKRTETIHICAENTIDEVAYTRLMGKVEKQLSLLEMIQ